MPHRPTLPLCLRHVLEQPVDRVVGVAALVDVLRLPLSALCGRMSTNSPSDIQRPRTSW